MLRDGYAVHRGVFHRPELDAFAAGLARASLTRSRAGARHLMSVPMVSALATDERLRRIACEWLGDAVIPFKATLFDKSPHANWLVAWHQDTAVPLEARRDVPGWGPWSDKHGVLYAHAPASALENIVALRVHLDDSTESNGPLRVLPGTHELGLLTDARAHDCARRIPAIDCFAQVGDVVAMRPLIVHASSKATSAQSRRVLHIEYVSSLIRDGGLVLRVA